MPNKRSRSSKNHTSNEENRTKNRIKPKDHRNRQALIEGEERKVHEEIVDRRITGGVTISKEAITEKYARALKQWQELPGSIVTPPTNVKLLTQKHHKFQDTETTPEQTNNETHNGE